MRGVKISIVIPVYNGSNYLKEAIDSALSQDYENFEVIVVNDGSNDNGETEEIALSYGNKIQYFKKENGGVATALNLAIEKATGEYVSWLSHDDAYFTNKLSAQVARLEELQDPKNTILSSNVEFIDQNSRHLQYKSFKYESDQFVYQLMMNSVISGCTLLIPIAAFKTAGGFDHKLKTTQDYQLWLRFAKAGYRFEHMDQTLVKSRLHAEQDSQKKMMLALSERKELEKFAFSIFKSSVFVSGQKTMRNRYFAILKMKTVFFIRNLLPVMILLVKKIGAYDKLSCLWRKYVLRK